MTQERLNADFRSQKPVSTDYAPQEVEQNLEVKPVEKVCVVHGANQNYFSLANMQVSQVRSKLRDVINVSYDAEAYINGKLVQDSYVLKGGEHLEFIKDTGVKGMQNCYFYFEFIYAVNNVPRLCELTTVCFKKGDLLSQEEFMEYQKKIKNRGFGIFKND